MAISVGKPSKTPDFRDGHFWGILSEQYIFRTICFLKTDFSRIHILKSPDFMKKIIVARRPYDKFPAGVAPRSLLCVRKRPIPFLHFRGQRPILEGQRPIPEELLIREAEGRLGMGVWGAEPPNGCMAAFPNSEVISITPELLFPHLGAGDTRRTGGGI